MLQSFLDTLLAGVRAGSLYVIGITWALSMASVFVLRVSLFRWEWKLANLIGIDILGAQSDDPPPTRAAHAHSSEPYTTADLLDIEWRETTTAHEHTRRVLRSVGVAPPFEEALFRAVPLLIATRLTGHVLTVMLIANAVWAYFHVLDGRTRHLLPHFIMGLLPVYLWLHGLGLLAVAVHAGHNLVLELILIGQHVRERYRPDTFSPGEVHQVTVRSEPPNEYALHTAETADGRTLEVADVSPGDACRVRVATQIGFAGYAYPLATDDTDESRIQ
jgi:Type II CAAX prenyl endopeptidase Rce1-like